MDLEAYRVEAGYYIHGDFKFTEIMFSLCKFESQCSHLVVQAVYAYKVHGSGPTAATGAMTATGVDGVFLKPLQRIEITTPLPKRNKRNGEDVDDSNEEDLELQSDLEEGCPAVDTDVESVAESGLSDATTASDSDSASVSESDPKRKKAVGSATSDPGSATGDQAPATKKPAKFGRSGATIFDNGYFMIKGHELDLKMHIHDRWLVPPPTGIGRSHNMSKTITPKTVGEERADPVRTLLLLKAWMLWRARQIPGWIESCSARQRLFTEEADLVLAQVKRMQPQNDRLLGNTLASKMMRDWVPDIVALATGAQK